MILRNIQKNVFNKKSNKLKSLLNRNAQLMTGNNEEEQNNKELGGRTK